MDVVHYTVDLLLASQQSLFPGIHAFFIPGCWYLVGVAKSLLRALKISNRWYDFWCRFAPVLFGVIYMLAISTNSVNGKVNLSLVVTNIVLGAFVGSAASMLYKLFKPIIKRGNSIVSHTLRTVFRRKDAD